MKDYLNDLIVLKNKQIEYEKYKIDIETDMDQNISDMLDNIINSAFDEYTIYNLAYKTAFYISEDIEVEIKKEICSIVSQRLSDTLYIKLKLIYNEDAITDIIAKRIDFKVTEFVLEHNRSTGIGIS